MVGVEARRLVLTQRTAQEVATGEVIVDTTQVGVDAVLVAVGVSLQQGGGGTQLVDTVHEVGLAGYQITVFIGIPLMTQQQADGVVTETAVPSQQLVEGVTLGAAIVLLKQTTGASLVTVLRVHVVGVVAVHIVHAEVSSELDALTPAVLGQVTTQHEAGAQTSNVTLSISLIEHQHTQ